MSIYFQLQLHKELNGHHACLTIKEYLTSSYAVEEKFCIDHKDKAITIGCAGCLKVYCAKCFSGVGKCSGGELFSFYWHIRIGLQVFKVYS